MQHSEDAKTVDSMSGRLSVRLYVWPCCRRRVLSAEATQVMANCGFLGLYLALPCLALPCFIFPLGQAACYIPRKLQ